MLVLRGRSPGPGSCCPALGAAAQTPYFLRQCSSTNTLPRIHLRIKPLAHQTLFFPPTATFAISTPKAAARRLRCQCLETGTNFRTARARHGQEELPHAAQGAACRRSCFWCSLHLVWGALACLRSDRAGRRGGVQVRPELAAWLRDAHTQLPLPVVHRKFVPVQHRRLVGQFRLLLVVMWMHVWCVRPGTLAAGATRHPM